MIEAWTDADDDEWAARHQRQTEVEDLWAPPTQREARVQTDPRRGDWS